MSNYRMLYSYDYYLNRVAHHTKENLRGFIITNLQALANTNADKPSMSISGGSSDNKTINLIITI
jgi:hypothetical protein